MATQEKRKTSIIYNKDHIGHKPNTTSPENPERLTSIMEFLTTEVEIFDRHCIFIKDYSPAEVQDVLLVHEEKYIDFIRDYCEKGGGYLGDSTYLSENSFDCALSAVGGAIKASEVVLERRFDTSFALIRPPGHHADTDNYSGYCRRCN